MNRQKLQKIELQTAFIVPSYLMECQLPMVRALNFLQDPDGRTSGISSISTFYLLKEFCSAYSSLASLMISSSRIAMKTYSSVMFLIE